MENDNTAKTCSYTIDSRDTVVSVNDAWFDFARESPGCNLSRDSILGRSLWSFMSDRSTVAIHRMIVSRVRETGDPIEIPLRCDGPDCRRTMIFSVHPEGEGRIRFDSTLVDYRPREHVSILDPEKNRAGNYITSCSWCNRFEIEPQTWAEVEDAVRELDLLSLDPPPAITHGICAECQERVMAQIQ